MTQAIQRLIRGFGSALELNPPEQPRHLERMRGFECDAAKLDRDWRSVGCDLARGFERHDDAKSPCDKRQLDLFEADSQAKK